ncbi:hypothetical protein GKZ90_0024860 [Flavobacterium sp. MC2016-06]|uniref:hypothetical protein n=1 Tax=Flavobacterium sp. MC2016-06 TaxID=2676308 RepID=UPI0012BAEF22|nr:hypothetical protein [Flavobacterium sp. MC2016-06]MBU3862266.1 hypothetical protein [Flavobacterium sp. MC2016-06]
MNPKKYKYIIDNLKWPFSHFNYSSHYLISLIPLTLIYLGITNPRKDNDASNLLIGGIILLVFIIYRIESERKFVELTLKKDLSTFEIAKLLEKNGWELTNQYDGVIEFRVNKSIFNQGETITIIRISKEKILINTQPNGKAVFTFFREILNYKEVKKILTN